MKRFFILASAAIVALAACTKTEVRYDNSQPQEIAFKQITGPMTKGLTGVNDGTMGVFAQYNNTDANATNVLYFGNTSFAKGEQTGKWHADPAKYWPLQGNLDFTIYAPYNSSADVVKYNVNTPNNLEIVVPDNKPNTSNTPAQTDWLYGEQRYCAQTKAEALNVTLKHGLSKILVTIRTDNENVFKVTGMTLYNTHQTGTLAVSYNETSHAGTCTATPGDGTYNHAYTTLGDAAINQTPVTSTASSFEELLVFPSNNDGRYFELKYKISGSDADLTAKIALSDNWEVGKKYTYAITLTATEILMVPTVTVWADGAVAGSGTTGDPIYVAPVSVN